MAREKIILDIQAEVADAKKRIKSLESSTKSAQKATTNLDKNFQKVGETAKKLAGVFVSLYALKKVTAFAKEVLKLADIQEKAEIKLLTALKGREQVQQRLIRQAQQLQKITLFGDEQTIEAQAFLASMGLTEQAIRRLTPLVQDLATKMGGDLVSAADLIAKSVGSSTNALSRYGITIEGAVGSSDRLESAIEGLNKQVGGQSEAAALVGTAAIQQFDNVLGDLKEKIGKEYLPVITAIFRALTGKIGGDDVLSDADKFQEALGSTTEEGLQDQLETWDNFFNNANQRFQEAYRAGNIEAQNYYSDQLNLAESNLDAIKEEIESRKEDFSIVPVLDDRQRALLKKQADEFKKAINTERDLKEDFQIKNEDINAEIIQSNKDVTDAQIAEAQAVSDFLVAEKFRQTSETGAIDDEATQAEIDNAFNILRASSSARQEGSFLQKTLAIGDATVSAYLTAQKAAEALADIPVVGPELAAAAYIAFLALGLDTVAQISAQSFKEGGFTGKSKMPLKDQHGRIAGVVHEDEFVFDQEKTRELRPFFEDIHTGRINAKGLAALTRRGVILPMVQNNFNSKVLENEVRRIYSRMGEDKPQRMTIETQNGYKKIVGNTVYNVKT